MVRLFRAALAIGVARTASTPAPAHAHDFMPAIRRPTIRIQTSRPAGLLLALLAACGTRGGEAHDGERDEREHAEPESHRQPGVIELTAEQLVTAKIATGKVERRTQAGLLEANATIEAAADRQARVGTRTAGRVTRIQAELGQHVRKGAVLAMVDSPELGRAKADYLAAMAAANVTRETAKREKSMFEQRISAERDWREAEAAAIKADAEKEAAENRLHALGVGEAGLPRVVKHYDSTIAVTAPIDGVVVERDLTLGQMVESTDTLFVVMDLAEVWILVDVYERDLSQVAMGQAASVRVGAYPEREFRGKVTNIGAVVEPKTRAVKVRVVLANPKGELKAGMFATVTIEGTTGEARQRLLAPAAAVQRDGERLIVFVPRGERGFLAREVTIARELGEWVEIQSGLSEGESVVTAGAFLLKSELKKGELGGGHSH
jgi:membrane fusion protein, heavy metal efflux system